MVANCKNGISSYEMARALGITQKSAWHMNHRIRLAMKLGTIREDGRRNTKPTEISLAAAREKMDGPCANAIPGTGGAGKTAVVGTLQRSRGENISRIRAAVIPNAERVDAGRPRSSPLSPEGPRLHRRALALSAPRRTTFTVVVAHAGEYVNGGCHTNGV